MIHFDDFVDSVIGDVEPTLVGFPDDVQVEVLFHGLFDLLGLRLSPLVSSGFGDGFVSIFLQNLLNGIRPHQTSATPSKFFLSGFGFDYPGIGEIIQIIFSVINFPNHRALFDLILGRLLFFSGLLLLLFLGLFFRFC